MSILLFGEMIKNSLTLHEFILKSWVEYPIEFHLNPFQIKLNLSLFILIIILFQKISHKKYQTLGFIVGKIITSLIEALLVKNITSLSIPIPSPPVGGIPYSIAVIKSSSIKFAS
ncbi:MAG: hypothetical protein RsTaC01_0307 [Candidatus Paraimprobicoccus trichonymphae]|uniref:Uncharacterized protein n=1 Tax=Candidatus Paraimprobicoccus trichonymphae TaxID=3033793 RepID=A0AA48L1C5_9FIRM|nr:MAG: hypothetical protein RsTaC01_0307 [Candidatus Paraimprobicoccus trichonymphae]